MARRSVTTIEQDQAACEAFLSAANFMRIIRQSKALTPDEKVWLRNTALHASPKRAWNEYRRILNEKGGCAR